MIIAGTQPIHLHLVPLIVAIDFQLRRYIARVGVIALLQNMGVIVVSSVVVQ